MKKTMALVLALTLALCLAACGGKTEPAPSGSAGAGSSQPAQTPSGGEAAPLVSKVGDVAEYGTFEGMKLEWRVLAIDSEGNRALLVTNDIAAYWAFNDTNAEVTWETCTLRAWLNGAFYDAAFTDGQKALILESVIANPANPESNVGGGADTTDRLFLLSYEEAERYFADDADRMAEVTFSEEYAAGLARLIAGHTAFGYTEDGILNELKDYIGTTDKWALRTSGNSLERAASVSYDGTMYAYGSRVDNVVIGVRPAMWVSLPAD